MNLADISLADQRQMFQQSLVRYGTEPVWINHIEGDCRADCLFIGNNEEKVLNLRDEKFNFKPVNVGYVNIQGYCFFISRSTKRQWKQGLGIDNIKIRHNLPYADQGRFENAYRRVRELTCKPLYNTIKNIYPSLEQVVESFEDNVVEGAFDRQFSVNHNGQLFYKSAFSGDVNLQTLKITFLPGMEFLEKAL